MKQVWFGVAFGWFVVRGGRNRGNRQTHRPSAVTFAAHVRRGLITYAVCMLRLVAFLLFVHT